MLHIKRTIAADNWTHDGLRVVPLQPDDTLKQLPMLHVPWQRLRLLGLHAQADQHAEVVVECGVAIRESMKGMFVAHHVDDAGGRHQLPGRWHGVRRWHGERRRVQDSPTAEARLPQDPLRFYTFSLVLLQPSSGKRLEMGVCAHPCAGRARTGDGSEVGTGSGRV